MSDATFRIDLSGDREVVKAMGMMNPQIHKKVLRSTIRSAMRPALAESKRQVPVESGTLRDSLKINVKLFPPFVAVGKVWPDKKVVGSWKGQKRWPIKYAHLVEGGHRTAQGGKLARKSETFNPVKHGGVHTGDVPPQPFIRDAFEVTKQEQIRRFRKFLVRGAQREWAKLLAGPKTKRRV